MLLARETAAELGVAVGDTLVLRVTGRRRPVRIVGLIDPEDARSRQALAGLVVADVATAQELLDRPGRLSRVDLALPDGARGEETLGRVRAILPPGAEVVPAAARSEFVGSLTRAFDVNLTALSLLALVVGVFLAYNTMTFSVVQRRATLGMARALGVTRAEIVAVVLADALLVGLVATALGLGLGVVLAHGLLRLVTRTINDLYFIVVVRDLAVSPAILAKGAALGVGATLLAAIVPAAEAAAAAPGAAMQRVVLEARARRAVPRAAAAGVLVLGAGGILVGWAGPSLPWSYVGLFAIVVGAALLTPLAMVGAAAVAGPWLGRALGLPGRMAARGVVATLSRTGVAVAALMVAVAAAVGVGVMIGSFRATVVRWLDTSLVADVYVSAPTFVGGGAEIRPWSPPWSRGSARRRASWASGRTGACGSRRRSVRPTWWRWASAPAATGSSAFSPDRPTRCGRHSRTGARRSSPSPMPTGTTSASGASCGCAPIGASARSPWPACSPTTAPIRAW